MMRFSSLSVVQNNYQQNELETYSQIDESNKEQILSKVNVILNILVCYSLVIDIRVGYICSLVHNNYYTQL